MNNFRNNSRNNGSNKSFSNKIKNISNRLSNTTQKATNTLKNTASSIQNKVSNQYEKAKNSVSGASSNKEGILGRMTNGMKNIGDKTKNFAKANSTISKVVFLLFTVVLFGILMRVGMYLISLFLTPSKNPMVVRGMRSTNKGKEYQVNPNEANPKPILRSINEDQGMEFTWSSWIFMEDVNYSDKTTKKIIFTKGKNKNESSDQYLMSSPGLFAHPTSNSIDIVLSTFDNDTTSSITDLYETITISNVPMKKWVNVIVRIQNNTVDVYLNGTMVERKNLDVVPKQNYGNIYVGDSANGMNGYISSLRYFSYAIGPAAIQDILYRGPSLKMEDSEFKDTNPPYLAMRWYFDQVASSTETDTQSST